MAEDESEGSDEWGMEELVIPTKKDPASQQAAQKDAGSDEDFWNKQEEPKSSPAPPKVKVIAKTAAVATPMIIVDLTMMDANIHSKFDKNSVNDAKAASTLRKTIESQYDKYAKNSPNLVSDGTVIPCGSSVWRDALLRLRDERLGHYFAPIFPPTK